MSAAATVLRLSTRGLRAHLGRLVLTVLAVVLSTAFISGTAVLSGVLNDSVDRLLSPGHGRAEVVVLPGDGHLVLPDDIPARLQDDPLVDRLTVLDRRSVVLTRGGADNGTTLDTGGVPVRPGPWDDASTALDPDTRIVEGTEPAPGEVAIGADVAATAGLDVGDELTVSHAAGDLQVTIAGFYRGDGDGGSADGTVRIALNEDDYRKELAADGLPGLGLTIAGGGSSGDVAEKLDGELSGQDDSPVVRTAADLAAQERSPATSGLAFLRYTLAVFGALALVVGMFIIANTFAMTVGQRLRDFALLRALGMSRVQVGVSVLAEAIVLGVLGSMLGVLAGLGAVVAGLWATAKVTSGLPLPDPAEVASSPGVATVLVPLVLGTLTTVVSAWGPARRAAVASPTVADAQDAATPLARRTVVGVVLAVLGAAATVLAVLTGNWDTSVHGSLCAAGLLAVLLGTYLLSPGVSTVLVPVLGRCLVALLTLVPGRPFRVPGRLAVRNAGRTPRRTAGTAFALTLGLCLVTVTGMTGASTAASMREVINTEVTADRVVAAPGGAVDVPVPGEAVSAVRETDGVGSTFTVAKALAMVGDPTQRDSSALPLVTVSNGDPSTVLDVGRTHGDLDLGREDGVTMSASYAADNGWHVGDMVPVAAPGQGRSVTMPLKGTYEGSRVLGDVVIGASSYWRLAPGAQGRGGHRVLAVFVAGDGSVGPDELDARLTATLSTTPAAGVLTPDEYAGEQSRLIDRVIVAVYALLALAVIVAVLGVINTLALSVVERRGEIGVLRAVGVTRGQVRRMVVVESLQTTLYGAVPGVLLGLGAGWAVLSVLSDVGLTAISVPWELIGAVLGGSMVLGVVAAVAPAVRAARVPPLDAVEPR
ncbi:ABC transporter permease [Corynebacterium sp. AOP40-9SA-29]|uniref:ABC transporter permease n=1 Tax=Corynebacterium sp. AOP40-9SA-29 TaxID=3457677 RepID=UPI0040343B75